MQAILEFLIIFLKVIPFVALAYGVKYFYDEMRAKRMYKARFNSFVAEYRAMRAVNRKDDSGKF